MWIASKFEEITEFSADQLMYLSKNINTCSQLAQMESLVLKTLKWRIVVTASVDFADLHFKVHFLCVV